MDFSKRIKGFVHGPGGMGPANFYIMFSDDKKSATLSIHEPEQGIHIGINLYDLQEIIKVKEIKN